MSDSWVRFVMWGLGLGPVLLAFLGLADSARGEGTMARFFAAGDQMLAGVGHHARRQWIPLRRAVRNMTGNVVRGRALTKLTVWARITGEVLLTTPEWAAIAAMILAMRSGTVTWQIAMWAYYGWSRIAITVFMVRTNVVVYRVRGFWHAVWYACQWVLILPWRSVFGVLWLTYMLAGPQLRGSRRARALHRATTGVISLTIITAWAVGAWALFG